MKYLKKCLCLILAALCLSFVLTGCEEILDHKIQVSSYNNALGVVLPINKSYKTGYEVTLKAIPNSEENAFLAWTKDGYIVSNENPYVFTASKETEGKYIALFDSKNLNIFQLTSASLSIPNIPVDNGMMETTVSSFKDISFQIGTTSDNLTNLANSTITTVSPPLFFTDEFNILPFVLDLDKKENIYYINFSITIEYLNTVSGQLSTQKRTTQTRINFDELGTTQNGNLIISQDEETGNYTITRKNLTLDQTWNSSEEAIPTYTLTFSKLNVDQML